jgi:hypothetical protein
MTPSHNNDDDESIADSEMPSSESMKDGHAEHEGKTGGLFANTLHRLKKNKDGGASQTVGETEDSETTSKKKTKSLLGKIVG